MSRHRAKPRVNLVEWVEKEPAIRAIRETVFIAEQGVPDELEWDGLDSLCAHALASSSDGEAIGTARMQTDGTIGRMAVLRNWRGCGVGQALLETLLNLAMKRGLQRATLAAQVQALGFYERAGFHAIGDVFVDAGIPHRMMVRDLLVSHPSSKGR
jgi:predicted GNAT family N-acyltransferase